MEHGEQVIRLAGCVLLAVGVAHALGLSPMVVPLVAGATVVNLSTNSRQLFSSLSQTDPPLYAIFFVLAGADVDVSLLRSLGVTGVVYVLMRIAGKLTGATLGSRWVRLRPPVRTHLRWTLLAQAGLAVGLTLTLSRRLPDIAPPVTAVLLSAVSVFEIIGPLSVRWALVRSGEAVPEAQPTTGLVE